MVPQDKVARLRMKLAEGGLPKGGGVGYEIFDKSDALGATSFIQNINHLRALEGELSRTIRSLDRVEAARVHLVLPDRPLFSRDKVEASASIVLKVNGMLEPQQVRAIRHLVATAVSGLKPERVSVIDETGKLLADGASDEQRPDTAPAPTSARSPTRPAAQGGRRHRLLGGRPRPLARADQRRFRRQPHHPDLRQIRSRRPRGALEPDARGASPRAAAALAARSRSATNCRAPRTRAARRRQPRPEQEERGNRQLRGLAHHQDRGDRSRPRQPRFPPPCWSTASTAKNDKGEVVYKPRSKEEIDRIAALVRSAIGFDAKRGDQVEVVNLRFAETPPVPINEPTGWMSYLQFTKDDIMRAANLGVMALLGLVVLFFVVRPLVRRIITPDGAVAGGAAMPARPARCRGHRRGPAAGGGGMTVSGGGGNITDSGGANISIVGGGEAGRHLQPHLRHDRRRQGAGPGARPVGAEGRRARRKEPARGGFRHPQLAARGRRLTATQMTDSSRRPSK